jgi:hypothetical protein
MVHFFQISFVSPSNHKDILPLIYEAQKMLKLWNIRNAIEAHE